MEIVALSVLVVLFCVVVCIATAEVLKRRWFPEGTRSVTYTTNNIGQRPRWALTPTSVQRLFEPLPSNSSEAHQTYEMVVKPTRNTVEILIFDEQGIGEYTKLSDGPRVGDIYLGVVAEVRSGLNAAFVDIGEKTHALVEMFATDVSDMSVGDRLVCQITHFPRGSKAFKARDRLVLDGYYMSITQDSSTISVQHLQDHIRRGDVQRLIWEMRKRCKERNVGLNIPKDIGSPREKAYLKDFGALLSKLRDYQSATNDPSVKAPTRLSHTEPHEAALDLIQNALVLTPKPFRFVTVVGGWSSRFIKDFEKRQKRYPDSAVASAKFRRKCPYRRQHLEEPLATVRKDLSSKSLLLTTPSGGTVIIESTTACTTIDINSSRARRNPKETKEAFLVRINEESTAAIARALRLLNIGGIIVIDYINVEGDGNSTGVSTRVRLRNHLETQINEQVPLLAGSRPPKVEVGEISELSGVLDLVRQRLGYSLWQEIRLCASEGGAGGVKVRG